MISSDLYQAESDLRGLGYPIVLVDRVMDAKAAVENLDFAVNPTPVVLSDISKLEHRQTILVKFLEETNLQVVLLASRDNVLPTVLSRVMTIVKDPDGFVDSVDNFGEKTEIAFGEEAQLDLPAIIRSNPRLAPLIHCYYRSDLPAKRRLLELLLERVTQK